MCNIEKKPYSEMTYAEFCSVIDNDDNIVLITGTIEDGWQIWKDEITDRFFYIERSINDASDFFEVMPVARIYYDDVNCITEKHDVITISDMFDAEFYGDQMFDDKIILWMFNRKQDIHPREEDKNE